MYILIAGGGKVGYYLAQKLVEDKHTVALVEKEKTLCKDIAETLNDVVVINGDACDPQCLEQAGVTKADVVAAVTGYDDDNLIICQLAKEKFGVGRTVARVNKPGNEHAFSILGVDVPVNSTSIIAKIIEEEVSFEDLATLMTFKKGKLSIVRVDLAENSPSCGKKVAELKLPENSVLVAIVRGERIFVPKGDTILQVRDDVILLTMIEHEEQVLELLLGKV
ncbi:MAG: TrkA family potassium uptake protein [Candidatus Omnitrophota bacterium]